MIHIIKQFLFFILFILGSISCLNGQQHIEFTYDASGNRITRQVIEMKGPNENTSDSTDSGIDSKEKIYTELIDSYKVTVFPNPNKGQFKIVINNLNNDTNASVYLHSISGVMIFSKNNAGEETFVDIGKYDNGAYILTVEISGNRKTWKIIKN